MNDSLNCPNCGAPVNGSKCKYCGTIIVDLLNLDLDGREPTYVRMRRGGKVYLFKALPMDIRLEMEDNYCDLYADNQLYVTARSPDYHLTLEMKVVPDRSFTGSKSASFIIIDPEQYEGGW